MKNFYNNLKNGLTSVRVGNTLDSILSRFCLASLILLTIGVGQAWGANVADTTATLVGTNASVTSNGVTFSISGKDVSRGNLFVSYYFQEATKEATLSWSNVPENYTINVRQLSLDARSYKNKGNGGSGTYRTSKCGTDTLFLENNKRSWVNAISLNSPNYFGLDNDGWIKITAVTGQLNYDNIVFTYTIGNNYSIAFNANGGSGTMSNLSMAYYISKNLTANAFSRAYTVSYDVNKGTLDAELTSANTASNYTFAGWATSADGEVVYTNQASVSNLTETVNGTYNFWISR